MFALAIGVYLGIPLNHLRGVDVNKRYPAQQVSESAKPLLAPAELQRHRVDLPRRYHAYHREIRWGGHTEMAFHIISVIRAPQIPHQKASVQNESGHAVSTDVSLNSERISSIDSSPGHCPHTSLNGLLAPVVRCSPSTDLSKGARSGRFSKISSPASRDLITEASMKRILPTGLK